MRGNFSDPQLPYCFAPSPNTHRFYVYLNLLLQACHSNPPLLSSKYRRVNKLWTNLGVTRQDVTVFGDHIFHCLREKER